MFLGSDLAHTRGGSGWPIGLDPFWQLYLFKGFNPYCSGKKLISRKRRVYQKKEKSINDTGSFGKIYKYKANLLLSTKLIIFLNCSDLGNWVL